MENYYKRIDIKTQADLPKIDERVFICKRNGVKDCWTRKPHDDDEDWVKRVDYYLLPCNEKIEALEELCALREKLIGMLDDILIDGYEHRFNPKGSLQELRQKISELESKLKEV
jgi:hypothetical protein